MAAWKHTSASYVEPEGVAPLPKGQGAEQGDVDGGAVTEDEQGAVVLRCLDLAGLTWDEFGTIGTKSPGRPEVFYIGSDISEPESHCEF